MMAVGVMKKDGSPITNVGDDESREDGWAMTVVE